MKYITIFVTMDLQLGLVAFEFYARKMELRKVGISTYTNTSWSWIVHMVFEFGKVWYTFKWIKLILHSITKNWKGLVHALSGLFCASLNFFDTTTYSYATGIVSNSDLDDRFRYGTMSRETVCTENLTPWKKLLPSRAKVVVSLLVYRIEWNWSIIESIEIVWYTLSCNGCAF